MDATIRLAKMFTLTAVQKLEGARVRIERGAASVEIATILSAAMKEIERIGEPKIWSEQDKKRIEETAEHIFNLIQAIHKGTLDKKRAVNDLNEIIKIVKILSVKLDKHL